VPIGSGAKGRPNALISPRGGYRSRILDGQPAGYTVGPGGGFKARRYQGEGPVQSLPFRSQPFSTLSIRITGYTLDSSLAPLADCTVHLIRTADDVEVDQGQSDAGGFYSLTCAGSGTFYVVAYKPGGPDVAGTTVNTLTGT